MSEAQEAPEGGLGRWQGRALAVFGGGVAALALPPFGAWYAVFPAVALIVTLVAMAPDTRSAAWRGWFAGVGWFGLSMHWIVQPFFVDVATTGWMAPFALMLLAGGLALFWGLAAWSSARIAAGPGRALAFAGCLTLAEALRGRIFTGLPWAEPGHALIGSEALALSALAGPHGMTLVLVGLSALSAMAYLARGPALGALPLAAGLALGLIPWAPAAPPPSVDAPVIRVVQINAPQDLKWQRDMIPVFFDRALGLTAAAPSEAYGAPDLIFWPETSLPQILHDSEASRTRIAEAAGGAQVIVGGQRYAGFEPRNVLVALDPTGEIAQVYDKHHLVPFGEYLPLYWLADWLPWDALAQQLSGGYRPGEGPALLDFGAFGRAFPMICYEAIFSHYIRQVERPDWMVQITNDAWFGSFAMPYQHLAIARLRAAEQGLPLVRAANTGISAVIDARGRVVEALPMDVDGVVDVLLPAALPPTLYARTGDLPALALALFATLCGIALGRRRAPH